MYTATPSSALKLIKLNKIIIQLNKTIIQPPKIKAVCDATLNSALKLNSA